jgi:transcription initiation factor IIE alpha subunit
MRDTHVEEYEMKKIIFFCPNCYMRVEDHKFYMEIENYHCHNCNKDLSINIKNKSISMIVKYDFNGRKK